MHVAPITVIILSGVCHYLFLFPYVLQGMYFDRDDVALPNFSTFFLERSVKEKEQAEKLLEYQNMRGGRILLQTIAVGLKQKLDSKGIFMVYLLVS